jgi:Ca-activated chloride channel family protein
MTTAPLILPLVQQSNADVRIRLVYIQAAHVDTSVGRYVYPLEDGGVDEVKNSFWSRDEVVTEKFSFNLRLRSGFPVDAVRFPQHVIALVSKASDKERTVNLTNFISSTKNDS